MSDLLGRLDEAVLRELIERATVSFWVLDEDERIRYVNSAGAALTGYALPELLDRPFSMLLDPQLADRHADWMRAYARRGGASAILGEVREFQLRHRSGEMIDIELKAFPLDAMEAGRRLFGAVISDNRDRKAMESSLRQRATHDSMTGSLNREGFFPLAVRAIRAARTHHRPLGLLLIDLDHFKRVNDRYGHQAGDTVLERVVDELAHGLREDDLLGRYGGEEFVVALPDAAPATVVEIAERLRQRIERLRVPLDGREVAVTVSIGCAMLGEDDDIDTLIGRADRGLYAAKRTGRNRVSAPGD